MHHRYHTPWRLLWFLIIIVALLRISDYYHWSDGVRGMLEQAMLVLRLQRGPVNNDKLTQLTARVASQSVQISQLETENEHLRKELGAPLPPSLKFIPADVISRQFDGDDKSLLIRAGKADGVMVDMPVLVERVLVGKISAVTTHVATIRLLTSTQSKITVKTLNGGVPALLVGKQTSTKETEGAVMLDKVLQKESISVNETVVTAGDEFMPPDISIGTITAITSEPRDPFKQADVSLIVNPADIRTVFIITES